MNRVRGFEKISFEQFKKDMIDEYHIEDEKYLQLIYDELNLPMRATKHSSGYDIESVLAFDLSPGDEIKLPTGFKSYMLEDEWLMIIPRSSFGFKFYTRLANTIGNGDSDYYNNKGNEGHYWIKIRNEGDKVLSVKRGDSVAQCLFQKYLIVDGDSFNTGEERVGGIGSSNK